MTKPIVGSAIVYVVQLVYAVHGMSCTNSIDLEGAMYVFGWFNCEFVLLYYVYMPRMSGMYL